MDGSSPGNEVIKEQIVEHPDREGWVIKSKLLQLDDAWINVEGLLKVIGNVLSASLVIMVVSVIMMGLLVIHIWEMSKWVDTLGLDVYSKPIVGSIALGVIMLLASAVVWMYAQSMEQVVRKGYTAMLKAKKE